MSLRRLLNVAERFFVDRMDDAQAARFRASLIAPMVDPNSPERAKEQREALARQNSQAAQALIAGLTGVVG